MRKKFIISVLISIIALLSCFRVQSQQVTEISVLSDKPGADVQPTMWGVFFEDINFAADGGIYAELVKNRSFEFSLPMIGWMVANFYSPSRPSNPHFMSVYIDSAVGTFTFTNEGFRGIGIHDRASMNVFIIDFKTR